MVEVWRGSRGAREGGGMGYKGGGEWRAGPFEGDQKSKCSSCFIFEGMRVSRWLARGNFPPAGSQSSYHPFFPFLEAAPKYGREALTQGSSRSSKGVLMHRNDFFREQFFFHTISTFSRNCIIVRTWVLSRTRLSNFYHLKLLIS